MWTYLRQRVYGGLGWSSSLCTATVRGIIWQCRRRRGTAELRGELLVAQRSYGRQGKHVWLLSSDCIVKAERLTQRTIWCSQRGSFLPIIWRCIWWVYHLDPGQSFRHGGVDSSDSFMDIPSRELLVPDDLPSDAFVNLESLTRALCASHGPTMR
jgi:hypothetical protein